MLLARPASQETHAQRECIASRLLGPAFELRSFGSSLNRRLIDDPSTTHPLCGKLARLSKNTHPARRNA